MLEIMKIWQWLKRGATIVAAIVELDLMILSMSVLVYGALVMVRILLSDLP